MSEKIKPKYVDGEPVCQSKCPMYSTQHPIFDMCLAYGSLVGLATKPGATCIHGVYQQPKEHGDER